MEKLFISTFSTHMYFNSPKSGPGESLPIKNKTSDKERRTNRLMEFAHFDTIRNTGEELQIISENISDLESGINELENKLEQLTGDRNTEKFIRERQDIKYALGLKKENLNELLLQKSYLEIKIDFKKNMLSEIQRLNSISISNPNLKGINKDKIEQLERIEGLFLGQVGDNNKTRDFYLRVISLQEKYGGEIDFAKLTSDDLAFLINDNNNGIELEVTGVLDIYGDLIKQFSFLDKKGADEWSTKIQNAIDGIGKESGTTLDLEGLEAFIYDLSVKFNEKILERVIATKGQNSDNWNMIKMAYKDSAFINETPPAFEQISDEEVEQWLISNKHILFDDAIMQGWNDDAIKDMMTESSDAYNISHIITAHKSWDPDVNLEDLLHDYVNLKLNEKIRKAQISFVASEKGKAVMSSVRFNSDGSINIEQTTSILGGSNNFVGNSDSQVGLVGEETLSDPSSEGASDLSQKYGFPITGISAYTYYENPITKVPIIEIDGNKTRLPRELSTQSEQDNYIRLVSESLSASPLFVKIFQSKHEVGANYFQKKFAERYPTEKMGQDPVKFYKVFLDEIAHAAEIPSLTSDDPESILRIVEHLKNPDKWKALESLLKEKGVIGLDGKISAFSIGRAKEQKEKKQDGEEASKILQFLDML